MPTLLPTFRVAYRIRDAKGETRGGAAQLRAQDATAAAQAARDLRRDAQSFEVVAVVAL